MSGPSQTTNSNQRENSSNEFGNTTTSSPYGPSQDLIARYLDQVGQYQPQTSMTGAEEDAYEGLQTASQFGIPQLQELATGLLGGFGFGEGREGINSAWQTQQDALNPYARGDYLDIARNPYMSQITSQIQDSSRNNVGDAFARAGRSFSGAHAGAVADATTRGLAPTLFNQFNLQQGNQMNAANALLQGSLNRSTGLDASRSGALGAAGMAPGVIGQIGSQMAAPHQIALQREMANRAIPYEGLQSLQQLLLPIASQFGTREATGFSDGRSRTNGTSTTQQQSDPFMTALGGGLGVLGLGMQPMSSSSLFGNWFG
jgi:hypothetical protein